MVADDHERASTPTDDAHQSKPNNPRVSPINAPIPYFSLSSSHPHDKKTGGNRQTTQTEREGGKEFIHFICPDSTSSSRQSLFPLCACDECVVPVCQTLDGHRTQRVMSRWRRRSQRSEHPHTMHTAKGNDIHRPIERDRKRGAYPHTLTHVCHFVCRHGIITLSRVRSFPSVRISVATRQPQSTDTTHGLIL